MTKNRRYWTGAVKAPAQDRFFVESLDPGIWSQGDKDNWDTCWHTGMPAKEVFANLKPGATINHIAGNNSLTVKSMLYATLSQARSQAPTKQAQDMLSFFPPGYIMPGDYHALQREAFANPNKRWIIKPKLLSRGRGIRVLEDAAEVPFGDEWLVQEYLDRPQLVEGRKHVLRLYLLIASIEPLRVYLYRDGFVKLASEPYTTNDFDNLYAHLTNPDINALNDKVQAPVVFLSFDTYRAWLKSQGADASALFARIREIAIVTAIAAREQMRAQSVKSAASWQGCYELIGLDCMVDADLNPWLLECNLSPSLETCAAPDDGGAYEEATKRGVVQDLVSLLGLNLPGHSAAIDLTDARDVVESSAKELARAGKFERVFPTDDAGTFIPFLRAPRFADWSLASAVTATPLKWPAFAAGEVEEFVFDDALTLYSPRSGRVLRPPTAPAFIWLKAAAGETAEQIAEDMATTMGVRDEMASQQALLREVTNAVADWVSDDFLQPSSTGALAVSPSASREKGHSQGEAWIQWAGGRQHVRWSGPEIGARLTELVAPLKTVAGPIVGTLHLVEDNPGYAIATQDALVKSGLKLCETASALRETMLEAWQTANPHGLLLDASCLMIDGRLILFANGNANQWDAPSLLIGEKRGGAFLGSVAQLAGVGKVAPLTIAGRLGAKAVEADVSAPGRTRRAWHTWRGCERGAFVRAVVADPGDPAIAVHAIVVSKQKSSPSPGICKALTGQEKLLALKALYRASPGNAHAPSDLFSWAEQLNVLEVRYSDGDDLIGIIEREV